ncbi:DUF59 domain-containing protein, partial [Candidatus Woesearchaeota archaeon]|nr:DUF59 domain-containing protein [Candidatus Woesearchaeota archaeon]
REQIIENVLKKYEDPELMIDVWTLGLIYDIAIENSIVKIKLTFTSPMCPYGPAMVEDIKQLILKEGASSVNVEVTFEPPWQPSEELKEMLGMV